MDRELPDLTITDLVMPGMVGTELVRQLRAKNYRMPIVGMGRAVNAGDVPMIRNDFTRAGANDFYDKNLPPDFLLAAVKAQVTGGN